MTVLDMRKNVESVIEAYARAKAEARLQAAWAAVVGFWRRVGPAPTVVDEDGDEVYDEHGAHHGICYRLLAAFEHVGFDPEDEDDEILTGAAFEVVEYLDEVYKQDEVVRDVVPRKGGKLANGTHFMVDLVKGTVTHSADPIVAEWAEPIRRTAAKVGRNDPCPCGLVVKGQRPKFKRCCGSGAGAAET